MVKEKTGFTASRIGNFKCAPGKKQTIFWDAKTPNFGLRVTSGGAKSYIFETWFKSKCLRLTIGDAKSWSLGKAQSEAMRLKVMTDQGIDPREVLAEQRAKLDAKELSQISALLIWEEFIQDRKHNWGERQLANYKNVVRKGGGTITRGLKPGASPVKQDGILRGLLSQPLSNVTREAVAEWIRKEAPKRPTWTRMAFSLLRAFITWARDHKTYKELVQADACSRQELPKQNSKDDCLQKEQLTDWFKGVKKINNQIINSYLQILLLTGARREELASLKWTDVDLKWKTIVIKDKVEGTRQIPITPYVELLLATIPKGHEYVFFSESSKSGRIQEPRKAHNNALELAGLPHLSIHGLRRSFGTLAEWVECPSGISAQIMGHKPSAIAEKHYRKRPIDMLRMWHSKIEKFILNEAGIIQPEENTKKLQLVSTKSNFSSP